MRAVYGYDNYQWEKYSGIFYAGYGVEGAVLIVFIIGLIYIQCIKSKPKFIKYDNNNYSDPEEKGMKVTKTKETN